MDNLPYAAIASTTQMDTIINTNAKLTIQLQIASETIKKLTEENTKLLGLVDKSITGGSERGGRGFGGPGYQTAAAKDNQMGGYKTKKWSNNNNT
eukprot:4262283-Ditylum_brightwellii.AAC.1